MDFDLSKSIQDVINEDASKARLTPTEYIERLARAQRIIMRHYTKDALAHVNKTEDDHDY